MEVYISLLAAQALEPNRAIDAGLITQAVARFSSEAQPKGVNQMATTKTSQDQLAKAVAVFCEMFAAMADPEHQAHTAIKDAPPEWFREQISYGHKTLSNAGFDRYGDTIA